jgi:Raf kinase inhibitor-like YbhB/YbcL family protein
VTVRIALALSAAALTFAGVACDEDERYPRIAVTSTALGHEETIPLRHTCDGANVSPPLTFDGAPEQTVSYAVIMDEPEAEGGKFTHWLLWGVAAGNSFISEELPQVENPGGSMLQGTNDGETLGYTGPCPGEEDTDEHRYVIRVYALDRTLTLEAGVNRKTLGKAIDGHIVGFGKLVGYYKRED